MSNLRTLALPIALAVVAISATNSFAQEANPKADPAVEAKIQKIEDSILPAILVKGRPTQGTTLTARMAALHVPGISVALIHNGKIEWAKGFGVIKIGGPPLRKIRCFKQVLSASP
jgi:CubicO group peptidase (beta-lactamase class C family)